MCWLSFSDAALMLDWQPLTVSETQIYLFVFYKNKKKYSYIGYFKNFAKQVFFSFSLKGLLLQFILDLLIFKNIPRTRA